jgi:hypothetical protein
MTDEWNEQQMTALDTNMGGATIGGTLAATLGTLTAGGNLQGNTKKIAKSFQNAWRGAAAYHFYMLALRQLYNGEDDDDIDDDMMRMIMMMMMMMMMMMVMMMMMMMMI